MIATRSKLLSAETREHHKGRRRLVAGFKKLKALGRRIKIGRTFTRSARKTLVKVAKLGKDRQERIKAGAAELANFARSVLARVPAALRKAKKHKDEKTQKQIEAAQEQIARDAELLDRVIVQSEARYAGVHVKS